MISSPFHGAISSTLTSALVIIPSTLNNLIMNFTLFIWKFFATHTACEPALLNPDCWDVLMNANRKNVISNNKRRQQSWESYHSLHFTNWLPHNEDPPWAEFIARRFGLALDLFPINIRRARSLLIILYRTFTAFAAITLPRMCLCENRCACVHQTPVKLLSFILFSNIEILISCLLCDCTTKLGMLLQLSVANTIFAVSNRLRTTLGAAPTTFCRLFFSFKRKHCLMVLSSN